MIAMEASWGTLRELEFIRKLGTHSEKGSKMTRESLLTGYLKGLGKRHFSDFDTEMVMDVAHKELEKEQFKMKVIK